MRALSFILIVLSCAQLVGAAPATRPNIVLFIADDMTWNDIGPYGDKNVRTPNLDRLAKDALRFDAAFAPAPTCTPSRSAIYTGIYPMRNGAHANNSIINDGIRTLPLYMKELGYRVVIAGKTHIGPRSQFPFEYLPESNVMPPGRKHVLYTDLNTKAVDKLLAEHDHATPLCLVVCSHSSHVYWMDNEGYDEKKITLPPYLLDTPETRQWRCKYYTDVTHADEQVGDVLTSLDKHGYAQNTLFAFTADQGAQWPFGKWNLYDVGIRSPLLVKWPGKVKPGTTNSMVSLIDLLPTFIAAAGGSPPLNPTGKDSIDGTSFLPVLLGQSNHHRDEIYAAHTGDGQMNRSPMRCIRNAKFKYILNLAPQTPYKTHIDGGIDLDGKAYWTSWEKAAETDAKAKAVVDHYRSRPAEELFDLQSDRDEQHNLAHDPAHAATLKDLREKLKAWRLQQGENLSKVLLPEDARKGNVPYAK
jgi:arylsulfatase A-like enzyme